MQRPQDRYQPRYSWRGIVLVSAALFGFYVLDMLGSLADGAGPLLMGVLVVAGLLLSLAGNKRRTDTGRTIRDRW